MKRTDFRQVTVEGKKFNIYPFSALKAANLSGELVKLIAPALGSISAIADMNGQGKNLFDTDVNEIAPALTAAVSSLSGDAVESLLNKLLLQNNNVAYDKGNGNPAWLSEDDLDEAFCGETQGIFVLAFEVVKTNYGGFFGKLGSRFGRASEPSIATTTV